MKGNGCEKRGQGGGRGKGQLFPAHICLQGLLSPGGLGFKLDLTVKEVFQIKFRLSSTLLEDGDGLESSQSVSSRLPVGSVLALVTHVDLASP